MFVLLSLDVYSKVLCTVRHCYDPVSRLTTVSIWPRNGAHQRRYSTSSPVSTEMADYGNM